MGIAVGLPCRTTVAASLLRVTVVELLANAGIRRLEVVASLWVDSSQPAHGVIRPLPGSCQLDGSVIRLLLAVWIVLMLQADAVCAAFCTSSDVQMWAFSATVASSSLHCDSSARGSLAAWWEGCYRRSLERAVSSGMIAFASGTCDGGSLRCLVSVSTLAGTNVHLVVVDGHVAKAVHP